MESLLAKINGPVDLKKLPESSLPYLAREIREVLIDTTSKTGGHIGPNLGVVELTIALHRIFDSPQDRFVFDVSHQGYVHKLFTNRFDEKFSRIRQTDGYSGFLCREESDHDCFGAGHAGTALSAALGMAAARDLTGGDDHVVAICGDAAFTCGITMEALNNMASSTRRLIVVLNDNEWSIDKNVGAISHYFNELITNPTYKRLHDDLESFLHKIPGGESLLRFGHKAKEETKDFVLNSSLFEKYGVRYIGPIDGHDLPTLHRYLEFCKASQEPVLLHIITRKGKGYQVAIDKPEKFHGLSPYDKKTGQGKSKKVGAPPAYQDVFGRQLLDMARSDPTIVGITGAMPSGTGLSYLRDELPGQYVDVGIAEEHAVLFAAGLATRGARPVVAIYSTFLQRAYDQIIHDVALQNLPILFCMDRAGLSPNDGPTHHGLFDIAYLRCVPNTIVMQPKNEDELVDMMHTGMQFKGPAFIRYPRGNAQGVPMKNKPEPLPIGEAEIIKDGGDIVLWALGPMVYDALVIAESIEEKTGIAVGVVNARFAKPLDRERLRQQSGEAQLVVTLEDHVKTGGFGSAVNEALQEMNILKPVLNIGWPDQFIPHGSSPADLRKLFSLMPDQIQDTILQKFYRIGGTHETVSTPSALGKS